MTCVTMSFTLDNPGFSTSADVSQEAPLNLLLLPCLLGRLHLLCLRRGILWLAATAPNATGG